MIIYLDESKRLWKWEIVIGGFLSFHNTSFIEKFIKNKKHDFCIPEEVELKSTNKFWRLFVENLKNDNDFKNLNIITFGFYFDNYFFDSDDVYLNLLFRVFTNIFNNENINFNSKVSIIHDDINSWNNNLFEKKVKVFLKEKLNIKSEFKIRKSKNILNLQLSDLIVSKYKEYYIFKEEKFDSLISEKCLENKKT